MAEVKGMSESAQHLTMENPKHRDTVEKVYDKWFGPMSVEHGNEGMAVQECHAKGGSLRAQAEEVSPKGMMFDVQGKNLSDRMFGKYSSRTEGFAGGKVEMVKPKSLSDRKYK